MKQITITIMLAFIVSAGMAQFHIRVECFGGGSNIGYQTYKVSYTNDNWSASKTINRTFDVSSANFLPFCVVHQLLIFYNKDDAIKFAKGLSTYVACERYNKLVLDKYQKLLAYRKEHPIKKTQLLTNKNCCKTVQIY